MFIDENGGGAGCATAQSSGAKAAQIVVPSSAVLCVTILMRIQSAFERVGIIFLDSDASGGISVRLENEPLRG